MFDSNWEGVRGRVPTHLSGTRSFFPFPCTIICFCALFFFFFLSAPQTWGFIFKKSLSFARFTALWNYEKGKLTLLHKVALGAVHGVDGGGS